jgi:arginase family enzyme
MTQQIDFGYENASSDWDNASLSLFFISSHNVIDMGLLPGPGAIADASRFIELFETQVGISPLKKGTYAEIINDSNPINTAAQRASEARKKGMFPIIVAGDRRITEKYCTDPLVALWGKLGRVEINETALFSKNNTILAGVRAATTASFQSVPESVAILTAESLKKQSQLLKTALKDTKGPIHLSIDMDVLCPGVAQTTRSIEPGGFDWYNLVSLLEIIFNYGPEVAGADLTGTEAVCPQTPAALLGAQIILKIAGLAALKASQ